jgi:predicted kinase
MTCGLPASGKTTTAARLHSGVGGALIRSCDVYEELGISLPGWVHRTAGFTRDVAAYERVRDRAYRRMLDLLVDQLIAGARIVILDAVHGEIEKRRAVFDVCAAHHAEPLLVWCRCDDRVETERRLSSRLGREAEPEREASDSSVFDHLAGLWSDPTDERCGSKLVPVLTYDTSLERLSWLQPASRAVTDLIERALLDRGGMHVLGR